jgi:hypothetical protein
MTSPCDLNRPRLWLAAGVLSLLAVSASAGAGADPTSDSTHPKPSSFAPHHANKSHVYGAPLGKPVLHKHKKKHPRPAAPGEAPAEPIK